MFAPIIRGDENGGPLLHHHVDKENSTTRLPLQQAGGAKSALQPSQGGSVRKALGNITNTSSKQAGQGFGAENKASSKPAPGSAQPRRAFGVDITNSASALKQQQAPPSEPGLKRKPFQPLETQQQQPAQQQPQPSQRPQLQQRSKAEVFAEDGIERLAGKGFREQEADRMVREEQEIEERVRQLTSAMSMWKPQAVSRGSDCGEEDLSGLSLTPTKLRPLAGPRRALESQSPEEVPLLLPDTPTAGPSHLEGSSNTGLPPQRVPLLTILPDPELDLDFDELA